MDEKNIFEPTYIESMSVLENRISKDEFLYVTNFLEVILMKRYFHKDHVGEEEASKWTKINSPKFRVVLEKLSKYSDPRSWIKDEKLLDTKIEAIEVELSNIEPGHFEKPYLGVAA